MIIDDTVIDAVTAHMNGDHAEDNLLIARAFGAPDASRAVMVGLDVAAGLWRVDRPDGTEDLTVAWPIEITERLDIRRAAVELYRAACAVLGVEPRREEPSSHGHHATGRGHQRGVDGDEAGGSGFSRELREATWGEHGDSEGAEFMADIMRGRGTLQDYAQLVAQHWFVYDALERASERLSGDPALVALHPPALLRHEALARDLDVLVGPGWRESISPAQATASYAHRIEEIAAEGWTAGIVAHHYTRYLGDLSGGQAIARRVATQFGLHGDGVAFYDFSGLGDLAVFKDSYRRVLDGYGTTLDVEERARMLEEVRAAYRFNTEVFIDLGRVRAAL